MAPLSLKLSVIIPTFNEESSIDATLKALGGVSSQHEVIVVDGGSSDRTCSIVGRHRGVALLQTAQRGRAAQQNEGARLAKGEVFFFLHADTVVPEVWQRVIGGVLKRRDVAGGAFSYSIDGAGIGYRILEWGAKLRNRILSLPYGDQGLFVRRELFHSLGGFQEIPIMEDIDFVRRLKRRGTLVILPETIVTSCRRYEKHGLVVQMLKNWTAASLFALGVSPQWISLFYCRGSRRPLHGQSPMEPPPQRRVAPATTNSRMTKKDSRPLFFLRALGVIAVLVMAVSNAQAAKFDQSHAMWGEVLRRYVSQGHVNYAGLKKDDGSLKRYLEAAGKVAEDDFENFSVNERKALLINVYNASAISLVLKHYPVGSIKELGVRFIGPWKVRFISLLGKKLSLDDLEHGILRKKLFDPRIHFALVCASKGCPKLYPVPFTGAHLDEQLDDAAGRYMNDETINRIDLASKTLYLSEIFRWFADDFDRAYGSVGDTARRFMTAAASMPKGVPFKIVYTTYDWSLND